VLRAVTGREQPARVSRQQWRSGADDHTLLRAANASRLSLSELKRRLASTSLDAEEARYVREVLYPTDAALHARYCSQHTI